MQYLKDNMKWVKNPKNQVNSYTDYVFDFNSDDVNGVIQVCSAGDYILLLNGAFIGCGQYNSYPEKKYADEYNVQTVVGKNRLAIIGYLPNKNTCNELADDRGIAFSIRVGDKYYVSSKEVLCRTSLTYLSGENTLIVDNIGYNISCDKSRDDEFFLLEKPLNGFVPCEERGEALVYSRPIKKLIITPPDKGFLRATGIFLYGNEENDALKMQNAFLSAKRLAYFEADEKYPYIISHNGNEGVYMLFDLKKESTGYFYIDIELDSPATIDYCWGENIDDLRVRAEISGRKFSGKVKMKQGRTEYTEYFGRLGLRYLMIFVHSNKFVVYGAGIRHTYYPIKKLNFKCDDSLEQKIFDTSVNTLHLCMHEHYEDCPWREQSQYIMDSRNQILAGFYSFENIEFVKASVLLMSDRIYDDGNIPLMQPSDFCLVIPNFTLCYFLVIRDYYDFTNDSSFVKEIFPRLTKIKDKFIERINEDGCLVIERDDRIWNFFEWNDKMINAFGDNVIDQETIQIALPNQAFLIMALENYVFFADLFGETVEKERLIINRIKETTNKLFFDEDKNIYVTYVRNGKMVEHYSEYVQALAICSNIATGKRKENIAQRMIDCRENNSKIEMAKCSLSNLFYEYEALLSFGDKYKSYVRDDIKKTWGKMLFEGATSFYEVEEGADAFYYAGSLCHGWSAIPAYFYGKYKLTK